MHTHTNARFIVVVGLPSFSVTDDEVFLSFLKRTYNPPADADLCWKNSLPKLIFIILQRSTAEIMQHVASCLCSVGSVDGLTTRDACLSWYFMITMCEWWWNYVSGVHHDQELNPLSGGWWTYQLNLQLSECDFGPQQAELWQNCTHLLSSKKQTDGSESEGRTPRIIQQLRSLICP